MRLFAAVLPPPTAVVELADAVAGLQALPGADELRWADHEGWHFTVAFYGEVAEAEDLRARLERAARRRAPFALRLEGGGRFGDRVLWAGAGEGVEALRRLAEGAGAAGRRAGLTLQEDRERRSYHPHLTLARHSRGEVDLRPFTEALQDFQSAAWDVRELALMRSHPPVPGQKGAQPRYEKVASWPLGRDG